MHFNLIKNVFIWHTCYSYLEHKNTKNSMGLNKIFFSLLSFLENEYKIHFNEFNFHVLLEWNNTILNVRVGIADRSCDALNESHREFPWNILTEIHW